MYTVLVCDDDVAILDSVEIYLKLEGYNVLRAENGRQAIEQVTNNEVHCVILDIMMPGMDGLQATLTLRKKHNIPIILLSAKSEDTDKITGLSFGADDYVTKPFNPLELMARVKSQIRRYTSLGSMEVKEGVITTGGLSLDTGAKELTRRRADKAHRHGVRHNERAHGESRQGALNRSDIRGRVERARDLRRENGDGTYQTHQRKNRDQPERP